MSSNTNANANDEQIAYWSAGAGDAWAAMQPRLDRQLEPLGRAALAALGLRHGERVVDVGCGTGTTTYVLAVIAGASNVLGLDVSQPMLAVARARFPQIRFELEDAATYDVGTATFDALYSRFGVMFFVDPIAAFANLARMLRPGGRLAFVCWRRVEENPIVTEPLRAAVAAGLEVPPGSPDPHAPGPFAFADDARVRTILAGAGFTDIALRAHDEHVGNNDPAGALELALRVGPLGRLLREQPHREATVVEAVRAALVPFTHDGVVMMPSATWLVTATRAL